MIDGKNVRIAQVSDIHIGPENGLVQGVDVRGNFQRVLNQILNYSVNFLVLSGDVASEFAEIASYKWVSEILKDYPIPWTVIGGNHDDIHVMSNFFKFDEKIRHESLYFYKTIHSKNIVFLDSSKNFINKFQLKWLEKIAAFIRDEFILFVHHPPAICKCRFMDNKYPLLNIDDVRETLKKINNLHHIFVGHYHTEKVVQQDAKTIYLTPSTMQQIDESSIHFKVKHRHPGWRLIDWTNDQLTTEVFYLPER